MVRAGYRCECAGACGQHHAKTEMRCPAAHGAGRGPVRLIAAPADPALSPAEAAAVPAEGLRAWCPGCFDRAAKRAREAAAERLRLEADDQPSLF
ncbi:hypothetical protein FHU37_002514 [Allostreptomyces psammosilenae]|uniref:Uncharacterized protein n=1 Tax=Allostreptomyces psammosilenae TaxID=1892865 RepID=A0A853A4E1_9ACTN|nr:hypothetical protein [Allostreptomyces psammosilenae]